MNMMAKIGLTSTLSNEVHILWETNQVNRLCMLNAYPSLQNMYSADDGNTEVFYFINETATFSSFIHEPEVVKF